MKGGSKRTTRRICRRRTKPHHRMKRKRTRRREAVPVQQRTAKSRGSGKGRKTMRRRKNRTSGRRKRATETGESPEERRQAIRSDSIEPTGVLAMRHCGLPEDDDQEEVQESPQNGASPSVPIVPVEMTDTEIADAETAAATAFADAIVFMTDQADSQLCPGWQKIEIRLAFSSGEKVARNMVQVAKLMKERNYAESFRALLTEFGRLTGEPSGFVPLEERTLVCVNFIAAVAALDAALREVYPAFSLITPFVNWRLGALDAANVFEVAKSLADEQLEFEVMDNLRTEVLRDSAHSKTPEELKILRSAVAEIKLESARPIKDLVLPVTFLVWALNEQVDGYPEGM